MFTTRKKVVEQKNASPPSKRMKVSILNEGDVDNTLVKCPELLLDKPSYVHVS